MIQYIYHLFLVCLSIISIDSSYIKSPVTYQEEYASPQILQIQELITNTNTYNKQNSTLLTLCRNFELYDLLETIQQFEDRFNKNFHYDWTFLNDVEFTDEFKLKVSNLVSGTARFGLISQDHWSYPSFIDQEKASQCRKEMSEKDIIYGGSESYRHMCRYQSGFFYKHELLDSYKYYWRVEPGVKLFCDLDYDVFQYMFENDKKYGFTLTMFEYNNTIPTLWNHVTDFIADFPHLVNWDQDNLHEFIMNEDKSYNLCHFWSNFEIGDLDFFRSDQYQQFFDYLDSKGGFFYERWGDAPVHSIAVALFLSQQEVHWFREIGYYHQPFLQCPKDDELYLKNKCSCDQKSDLSFDFYSCLPHYFDIMGWELPSYAE